MNVLRAHFITVFFFCLCAVLLRWPVIPFIDSAPLEPNFPLHALAAKSLSEGSWLSLPYLQWPEGAPVRYIAWPVLIFAIPLNFFLSAIASMNVSIFLWTWIQGLGGFWIGKKATDSIYSAFFLGLGCMFSPIQMIAMGNGQFENMAMFPLIWFFYALKERRSCFIPFALCLFSSPYQAIAALLAIPFCLKPKHFGFHVWRTLIEILLLLGIGYVYFDAVSKGTVHESVTPAPAVLSEKAIPSALFLPNNIAENGGRPLAGPLERLLLLFKTPIASEYNHSWPWNMSTAGSYVGWTLWIGLIWSLRNRSRDYTPLIWSGICLLCSFGSTLGDTSIPLPWTLSSFLPGLSQMQATSRFLSGVSAGLLLYIAIHNKRYIKWFILPLILEGLLVSPAYWPIPARAPLKAKNIAHIDQPVAFWPAAPVVASHKVTMTALMLEQPLALFAETNVSMPNANGLVEYKNHRKDIKNRDPSQWKKDICAAGVQELIQFKDIVGDNGQPFFYGVKTMNTHCAQSFCIWTLCKEAN